MTARFVVLAALAAGLLGAPVAAAAPPRSAFAFVEAVEAARPAIKAAIPEVDRRLAAIDWTTCNRAAVEAPRRVGQRAGALATDAFGEAVFDPLAPTLAGVVAALDRVETRDPALRAGRRAWRATARAFVTLSVRTSVAEPCDALRQWRAARWAEDAAPITRREARRVLRELAEASFSDRGLIRAVRRLQVLGIPDRRARRFLGYWLTRPVDAVLLKYDPER